MKQSDLTKILTKKGNSVVSNKSNSKFIKIQIFLKLVSIATASELLRDRCFSCFFGFLLIMSPLTYVDDAIPSN